MKNSRKNAILEIVSKYEVDTQETLQALLLERGFNVTQATVSRDIKQLSLVKIMSDTGSYKYSLPPKKIDNGEKSMFENLFNNSVTSIDRGMNTIVIKCHTGMANAVCSYIDAAEYGEIVGTLAGDDTIFVLMRSEEDAKALQDKLTKLL